jgi:hypothetical protein
MGEWDVVNMKPAPKSKTSNEWEVADMVPAQAPNAGLAAPPGVPVPDELRGIGSIGAPRKPKNMAEGVENFANKALWDVQYGGDATPIGKILKLMGAKGTRIGSQAEAGDFMGSPVTGPINVLRGSAINSQEGRRGEGAWEGIKGLAETGQIPGMVIAPEATPVVGQVARKGAAKVFGSVSQAEPKFQEVMGAAKDVPIDLAKVQDAVARTIELSKRGHGTPPSPIKDFIARMDRVGELGPITYQEARDFASAAGKLSAAEKLGTSKSMFAQLKMFAKGLGEANAGAADQAGKLEQYTEAMDLFRKAMNTRRVAKNAGKVAVGASGLYGTYRAYNDLTKK